MSSIYQRGKIFWISYRTAPNAALIQHSLKTKDKTIAKFKKNKIENQLAVNDSPLPNKQITAQKCFDMFKNYREGRLTADTNKTDHWRIQNFLDVEKIQDLKQITELCVKHHLDKRINNPGKKIVNRTANHTIRALKTFLTFCSKNKFISENPIKHMPRYPVDQIEPRFLNENEVHKLMAAAKETKLYPLIATAIYTGMRLGELSRLQWQDINFKNNMITVNLSKNKKFRKIPLHSDLKKILNKYKAGQDQLCFDTAAFHHHFKVIRKDAMQAPNAIKYFRFHDLRHTFASLLIKSGVDILTVSKLLGHSSIIVTQIYSHLYQDHVTESIGKIKL